MLKTGKVSEAVYKRSVQKNLKDCSFQGRREDCSLNIEGHGTLGIASGMTAGTDRYIAAAAVHQAVNRLAASGAEPAAVTIQLTVPDTAEESLIKELSASASAACRSLKIAVVQSDAAVVSGIKEAIVSVTAMGVADSIFISEPAAAGQDIIMTGYAGYRGSVILANLHKEDLAQRFNEHFLEKVMNIEAACTQFSAVDVARCAASAGVRQMYAIEDGGVFAGLWRMSEKNNCGVKAHLKNIPLLQETVEICDYCDVSPYQILSTGSMLLVAEHGQKVLTELAAAGIPAVIIGHLTDDNDRVVINEEEVRYLEPFRQTGFV